MAVQTLEVKLRESLSPVVAGLGCELVDVEWIAGGDAGLLRLYIDHPDGVGIEHCERVSREVSALLDVEDPVPGEYRLEVSSPGLDRPLVTAEHFRRFLGGLVKVRLRAPLSGRSNFKGRLQDCDGQTVTVEVDGEAYVLPLADVERARLVPEF